MADLDEDQSDEEEEEDDDDEETDGGSEEDSENYGEDESNYDGEGEHENTGDQSSYRVGFARLTRNSHHSDGSILLSFTECSLFSRKFVQQFEHRAIENRRTFLCTRAPKLNRLQFVGRKG